jgi:hypothetical protein
MSRRIVIYGTVPFAIALFALGWLIYPQLLAFVAAGISGGIAANAAGDELAHRLWSTLPFGLLGLAIALGTSFVAGRSSARLQYGSSFLALLSVAILAASAWTRVLAERMASLVQDIPMPAGVSLNLAAIPLYEVGLSASVCVVVAAVLLAMWRKKN